MARGTYVYVVLDRETGEPIAGFTVRRELVTWLERRDGDPGELRIWRCGDGLSQGVPQPVTLYDLLPGVR